MKAIKQIKLSLFSRKRGGFGTVRWTYNKAVEFHREHKGMPLKEMKEQVREKFLNNGNFNGEDKSLAWVLETPRYIRSDAVDDFFNGVKTSLAAGRTGFKMKFRGRKDKSQSLSIQAREWNHSKSIRQLFFGEARIKARDKNYKVPSALHSWAVLLRSIKINTDPI
ncbi:hypothetical protein QOT17_002153 [Balamuthia mandrillaris]